MDQNWIDAENQKAKETANARVATLENILKSRDLARKNQAKKAKMVFLKPIKDKVLADYNNAVEMLRQLPPQFVALEKKLNDCQLAPNNNSAEIEASKKELVDEENRITECKRRNDEVCLKIKNAEEEIEKIREELAVEIPEAEAHRELERIRAEIASYQFQRTMATVVQVKEEPQEEMAGRHDVVPRSPEPEPSEFYSNNRFVNRYFRDSE